MPTESPLLGFLLVACVVAGSMLVGARLLRVRAKHSSPLKSVPYECGEAPGGGVAWVRFHARYYVVALFFVVFDIEAAFLFPWALVVKQVGVAGLVAVGSFVLVLMLGWLWAVRRGALTWQ